MYEHRKSHRVSLPKTNFESGERKIYVTLDGMPFIFLRQPTITLASRLNYEQQLRILTSYKANAIRRITECVCVCVRKRGWKSHNITKFRNIPKFI